MPPNYSLVASTLPIFLSASRTANARMYILTNASA